MGRLDGTVMYALGAPLPESFLLLRTIMVSVLDRGAGRECGRTSPIAALFFLRGVFTRSDLWTGDASCPPVIARHLEE